MPNTLHLVEEVAATLLSRRLRLATAESCTGGMLAQECTALAGSSDWFECGWVTYSNTSKTELINVDAQIIEMHGAVSAETVSAMTAGVLANSCADIAVAISGVAGPGGGSEDKPVGTVYIAWRSKQGEEFHDRYYFSGDRHQVRTSSVETALTGVLEILA